MILNGGPGNDEFFGNAEDDAIIGGLGHDTLHGCLGDDLIDGSPGGDMLDGNTDIDRCRGGAGSNTIVRCGHSSQPGGQTPPCGGRAWVRRSQRRCEASR